MHVYQSDSAGPRASTSRGLSPREVERLWGWAQQAALVSDRDLFVVGIRAARARNASLLRVLEACAEQTLALEEAQRGQSQRGPQRTRVEQAQTAPPQHFREAMLACERYDGSAGAKQLTESYGYVYGAAAIQAGLHFSARYR